MILLGVRIWCTKECYLFPNTSRDRWTKGKSKARLHPSSYAEKLYHLVVAFTRRLLVKSSDIKVLPSQSPILQLLGDLASRIPPKHSNIDHASSIPLLDSRGKIWLGLLGRISLQCEPHHVLQYCELAWCRAAVKGDCLDLEVSEKSGEAFVLLEPRVLRGPDNTQRCRRKAS